MGSLLTIVSDKTTHFSNAIQAQNKVLFNLRKQEWQNEDIFQQNIDNMKKQIENLDKSFKGVLIDSKIIRFNYFSEIIINQTSYEGDQWKKIQTKIVELVKQIIRMPNIEKDENGRSLVILQNFINFLDSEIANNSRITNRFLNSTAKILNQYCEVRLISGCHMGRVADRLTDQNNRRRKEMPMTEWINELYNLTRAPAFNKIINDQSRKLRSLMNQPEKDAMRSIEVICIHNSIDLYLNEKVCKYDSRRFGNIAIKRSIDGKAKTNDKFDILNDDITLEEEDEKQVTREEIEKMKEKIVQLQIELQDKKQQWYQNQEKAIKDDIHNIEKEPFMPSKAIKDMEKDILEKKTVTESMNGMSNIDPQLVISLQNTTKNLEEQYKEARKIEIKEFEKTKNSKIVEKNQNIIKLQNELLLEDKNTKSTPYMTKIEIECKKVCEKFQEQASTNKTLSETVLGISQKLEEMKLNQTDENEVKLQQNAINILEKNKIKGAAKIVQLQRSEAEKIIKLQEKDEEILKLETKVLELEKSKEEMQIINAQIENQIQEQDMEGEDLECEYLGTRRIVDKSPVDDLLKSDSDESILSEVEDVEPNKKKKVQLDSDSE